MGKGLDFTESARAAQTQLPDGRRLPEQERLPGQECLLEGIWFPFQVA
ncbi:hypothetical protein HMPREF9371_1152 [Neisseria shayeganii 871]|uniref:Uncharacterized protein n=1 Tax=Neisseria shayeganii 871 TaxID=1032488 RepID=G4CHR3_9NEIS|nr:hypothetical protein HMPREF9371_1152 [Neisseria shayeganii 871]